MITDRIGQGEVLLTINHDYNKISDVLALLKIKKNTRNSKSFLASMEKKPFKCACYGVYRPITQEHDTCCPITLLVLKSGQLIANQI